jgi:hypothetical protein
MGVAVVAVVVSVGVVVLRREWLVVEALFAVPALRELVVLGVDADS